MYKTQSKKRPQTLASWLVDALITKPLEGLFGLGLRKLESSIAQLVKQNTPNQRYCVVFIVGEDWSVSEGLRAKNVNGVLEKTMSRYCQWWSTGKRNERVGVRIYDKTMSKVVYESVIMIKS